MNILLCDLGNSGRLKWQLGEAAGVLTTPGQALPPCFSTCDAIALSSVADAELSQQYIAALQNIGGRGVWQAAVVDECLGLKHAYHEPSRLGVDRWLAMLAAWHSEQSPVLVIDAGSAITADFVDSSGAHLGGYITPGRGLMESALRASTSRVKFADLKTALPVQPGAGTDACVAGGLLQSSLGFVRECCAQAETLLGANYQLLVAGGDADLIAEAFPAARLAPELVLEGLQLAFQQRH